MTDGHDRHGVKPDGQPMVFMPTADFHEMSDEEIGALWAYLQTLPPVASKKS